MLVAGSKAGRADAPPETISEADQLWRSVVAPVDPFLDAVAQRLEAQVDAFDPEVAPYARYALTSQGKQLRPALLALSAGAAGKIEDDAVTAAVIIEMIHLATLVHDDIMDEASVRRRRPTLAANSGNQVSVLLGDCLFAHALKLAAGFPTTEVCRAVSSATKTVCSGEILQTLRQRERVCSRDEYFRILQMKTAELFTLSCDLGAWLGGATQRRRAALRRFGLDLGIAYQVYDDCVDLYGSERSAGKSLGTDLAGGKLTLPVLVALERASREEAAEIRSLIHHWDATNFKKMRQLLDKQNALDESRGVIHGFLESAQEALEPLAPSGHREALANLARFLAKQTDRLGV